MRRCKTSTSSSSQLLTSLVEQTAYCNSWAVSTSADSLSFSEVAEPWLVAPRTILFDSTFVTYLLTNLWPSLCSLLSLICCFRELKLAEKVLDKCDVLAIKGFACCSSLRYPLVFLKPGYFLSSSARGSYNSAIVEFAAEDPGIDPVKDSKSFYS